MLNVINLKAIANIKETHVSSQHVTLNLSPYHGGFVVNRLLLSVYHKHEAGGVGIVSNLCVIF